MVNPVCEAYDTGIEDSAHLFWECDKVREHVGDDTLELVLMIAWNIWYNRNQVASLSPGYKVNVDSATFTNSQSSGMRVIIQDIVGQVEAAMSKRLPIPLGTLESKAKPLEDGVLFAWDVGVREVVFKSDSKIIIDALWEVSEALTTICNIIKGI
nr:hypothetical protein CFP56_29184 [Quercus suber]